MLKKLLLAVSSNKKRSIIIGVLGTAFILGMGIVALKWWTAAQNPTAIASVGGEVLTLPIPEAPAALVLGKYPYYLQADPAWANMRVVTVVKPCLLLVVRLPVFQWVYPVWGIR